MADADSRLLRRAVAKSTKTKTCIRMINANSGVGCPGFVPSPGCGRIPGDPDAPYPGCCSRPAC
ncbi:hypothetical protein BDF19DRAFT_437277 [Syncephalis fuscata]|nr:hypothetical protein BDF19DRAFT_443915 [Syncephalis fuscata]KAI9596940.1 hypothetical protein BDF19DRAFT_437277 [Syncephalis fuscata]